MLDKVLRFFITALMAITGAALMHLMTPFISVYIGSEILKMSMGNLRMTVLNAVCIIVGAIIGIIIGFFTSNFFISELKRFAGWVETQLNEMPIHDIIAGVIGLSIGLIIAALLGPAFSRLPVVGDYSMVVTTQTSSWLKQGIHNLLWVWTSEIGDDDWYPGDDYVDIVARDGYPKDNNTHLSQAADFRRLRQAHPNKMTALPETNSVPSWENMVNDNALWLIVAPWCGGTAFDNGNTADFWQHFLNDAEGIISRDEVK